MLTPLIVAMIVLHGSSGYRMYRDQIPNGQAVPHPCVEGSLWEGVGHQNQAGAGDRNPFGKDFGLNGKIWDECLCETDSDGDGQTNGEELGDPDCVWKLGDTPAKTDGLSHPGICEPINSASCMEKNKWDIECVQPGFHCEPLELTEDRENVTVSLSKVQIPSKMTTYYCQVLEFPQDKDYHIIATEPDLDNDVLTHHIVIYGCPDYAVDDVMDRYSIPAECNMLDHDCRTMLLLWTVGYYGTCFAQEYGIKVGPNGFTHGILEVHYTNPEVKAGYEDASGLVLHYTPTLRHNDGGRILASPMYLELPPHQLDVVFDGGCPAECTNSMFQEAIHIAEIVPHMHYLGRRMIVEHRRNHSTIKVLVEENSYEYDSPKQYLFNPPYTIEPGDEIYVRCHFDTTEKDVFTYFGFATYDEMCFPLTLFYPMQPSIADCFTSNEIGYCSHFVGTQKAPECLYDAGAFFRGPYQTIIEQLQMFCDPEGIQCWPGCQEVIDNLRLKHYTPPIYVKYLTNFPILWNNKLDWNPHWLEASQHSCLQEGVDHIVLDRIQTTNAYSVEFIQMMASCDYALDSRQQVPAKKVVTEDELLCDLSESTALTLTPTIILNLLSVFGAWLLVGRD